MAISTDTARPAGVARHFPGAPRQSGQAMIESLIVILVVCFLLFSLLELARGFAGREVLRHSAARAARARTVGFNDWMCTKVMRVAAIPNAGKMLEPDYASFTDRELRDALASKRPGELWDWSLTANPRSERAETEAARIPDYLASEHDERARHILDYEGWDDLHASGLGGVLPSGSETLEVKVQQKMPLGISVKALCDWVGLLSPSLDRGYMLLGGKNEIENHHSLYLDDKGY
jgi:hypothetical protein